MKLRTPKDVMRWVETCDPKIIRAEFFVDAINRRQANEQTCRRIAVALAALDILEQEALEKQRNWEVSSRILREAEEVLNEDS